MLDNYNEVLTIKDASEILGFSERSIYDLLRSKKLAGFIMKNRWIIPKSAIEKFLNDNAYGTQKGGAELC